MDADKLERLRDKVIFISGSSKNAGKTTFLNYLLPRLRSGEDLAYLTIGIDGEKKDRVFGNEKPSIEAVKGDYLVTSEDMMNNSQALFKICHVFPWFTALGRLMLLKTERSGLIELVGPESNSQLEDIIGYLKDTAGIKTVLVDGAVNRITQLSAGRESAYFYVMKMTPENRTSSLNTIRTLNLLDKIPCYDNPGNNDIEFNGALTSSVLDSIAEDADTLVLEDFTKVFLTWRELRELTERISLKFRHIFKLEGLILNLSNLEQAGVETLLRDIPVTVPYYFNPYRISRSGM
ncbi:hypothetical protein [Spirochaeta isovalerica]|uniref:Uncharacterized protein n=1 Tax=Spirochaeta isovalerica TaxID=150 RepID=A0A841R5U4_9SPIO|nr:hypothetical protein [Spirochaeta isovalerica]MBB6478517.1 hypothetical protein [Spirochaeta isovalerica]